MTDLVPVEHALPEPGGPITEDVATELVSRSLLLREQITTPQGAEECHRQLEAWHLYLRRRVETKALKAIEGELRQWEVLIGKLLGPPQPGKRTDLTPTPDVEVDLHPSTKAEFRRMAQHEAVVEDCVWNGTVTRAGILDAITTLETDVAADEAVREFPNLANLPPDEAVRLAAELRAYPEGPERDKRHEAVASWHRVYGAAPSQPDLCEPLYKIQSSATALLTLLEQPNEEAWQAADALLANTVRETLDAVAAAARQAAEKPSIRRVK